MATSLSKIDHFVVLMLENRSFDHMLGWLKQQDPRIEGLTGTETNPVDPNNPAGPTIQVTDTADYTDPDIDPGHHLDDTNEQLFGSKAVPQGALPSNTGFVANYAAKRQKSGQNGASAGLVMHGFTPAKLLVLSTLGREFAICDRWFASVPGPTWPNRFFVHCGWSGGHYDHKMRLYNMRTIYEELASKKRTWGIYLGGRIGQSMLLFRLTDPARAKNVEPIGRFFWRAEKDKLPNYSFIEPDYFGVNANDQHPPHDVRLGETLVAQVYEALRQSPAWDRLLLIITYDEHGGLFDHVAPPAGGQFIPHKKHDKGFDFSRLGIRVPAVLVSPYIAKGTVDHTVYDHTSILATVGKRFEVKKPLSQRVANGNTFEGVLSLDSPRTDAPAKVTVPLLVAARRADETLPLSDLQQSFVDAAQWLEVKRLGRAKLPRTRRGAAGAPVKPMTRAEARRYVEQVGTAVLRGAKRTRPKARKRPARRRRKRGSE